MGGIIILSLCRGSLFYVQGIIILSLFIPIVQGIIILFYSSPASNRCASVYVLFMVPRLERMHRKKKTQSGRLFVVAQVVPGCRWFELGWCCAPPHKLFRSSSSLHCTISASKSAKVFKGLMDVR